MPIALRESEPSIMKQPLLVFILLIFFSVVKIKKSDAQENQFTLSQAITTGLNNYQSIQAKRNYLKSSTALVQNVKNQYLPDVVGSLQQAYGTLNGQYGAITSFGGGAGISSSGPVYTNQNWNAGFGSIYLINTNWEFISFGRLHSKIQTANKQVSVDSAIFNAGKIYTKCKNCRRLFKLINRTTLCAQRTIKC